MATSAAAAAAAASSSSSSSSKRLPIASAGEPKTADVATLFFELDFDKDGQIGLEDIERGLTIGLLRLLPDGRVAYRSHSGGRCALSEEDKGKEEEEEEEEEQTQKEKEKDRVVDVEGVDDEQRILESNADRAPNSDSNSKSNFRNLAKTVRVVRDWQLTNLALESVETASLQVLKEVVSLARDLEEICNKLAGVASGASDRALLGRFERAADRLSSFLGPQMKQTTQMRRALRTSCTKDLSDVTGRLRKEVEQVAAMLLQEAQKKVSIEAASPKARTSSTTSLLLQQLTKSSPTTSKCCSVCGADYTGFGIACGSCRRHKKAGMQQCVQCAGFFVIASASPSASASDDYFSSSSSSGSGGGGSLRPAAASLCEDCSLPKDRATALQAAAEALNKLSVALASVHTLVVAALEKD